MNSSLNSASPVICTSGRTSTPSCSMSIRKYVSPRCLGASWLVRASSMHHFDWCANVVHTFWPVTTYSSPWRHRAGLQRREVGARLGLAEALAPDLVGAQDRREEALLLLVGAVGDHASARPSSARARWPSAARGRGRTPRRRSPARSASRRRRRTRSARSGPAQPRSLSLRCQSRRNVERRLVALGLAPGMVLRDPARAARRGTPPRPARASGPRGGDTLSRRARGAGAGTGDAPAWAARRSPRRPGSAPARRSRRP